MNDSQVFPPVAYLPKWLEITLIVALPLFLIGSALAAVWIGRRDRRG